MVDLLGEVGGRGGGSAWGMGGDVVMSSLLPMVGALHMLGMI